MWTRWEDVIVKTRNPEAHMQSHEGCLSTAVVIFYHVLQHVSVSLIDSAQN